jgi:hypothetical protein
MPELLSLYVKAIDEELQKLRITLAQFPVEENSKGSSLTSNLIIC